MKKVSEQILEAREARGTSTRSAGMSQPTRGWKRWVLEPFQLAASPAERPEKPDPRRGSRRPPQRRPLSRAASKPFDGPLPV